MVESFMFKPVLEKHYGKRFTNLVKKTEEEKRQEIADIHEVDLGYKIDAIHQVNFFITNNLRNKDGTQLSVAGLCSSGTNKYAHKSTCGELEIMLDLADTVAKHYNSKPGLKILDGSLFQTFAVTNVLINVDESEAELVAYLMELTYKSLNNYRKKILSSL